MKLTIAVASDFHCHPSARAIKSSYLLSDGSRIPQNAHPIQCLVSLIKREGITADIMALPGDFTDKADHHGFIVGVYLARELAAALGVNISIASLGNHDVDSRNAFSKDPWYLANNLMLNIPFEDTNERNRFYNQGFAIRDDPQWRCLIINSVFHHTDAESAERGLISEAQLEALEKHLETLEFKELQFCLFHHHPIAHENMNLGNKDLMVGGEKLLAILEKHHFNIAIHGHKHHPRLRYSTSGSTGIPVFAAGSLSAVLNDILVRSVRNTFHIISLSSVDDAFNYPRGTIETWEYSASDGWIKSTRQSSGFPGTAGFGYKVHMSDLAERIEVTLGTSKYLLWSDLISAIPDLSYLSPNNYKELASALGNKKIKMDPNYSDPNIIGRI